MSPSKPTSSRFVRYAVVGASGVPIDLLTVAGVLWAGIGLLPAQLVGWFVAATWNYSWNRHVTFDARGSLIWQWVGYLTVQSGSLGVRTVVVAALAFAFPSSPDLGLSAFGLAAGMAVGFLGSDRVVFGKWYDKLSKS